MLDSATQTITYRTLTPFELNSSSFQDQLVNFLFHSLEQYRDPKEDIRACLDYILNPEKGGHVFIAINPQNILKGVVFLTNTGMGKFVPEYLLVYIAIDKNERGQGVGRNLMKTVFEKANAPIALHVEHDNPAKRLYEKLGFTNKYTEMRWYP